MRSSKRPAKLTALLAVMLALLGAGLPSSAASELGIIEHFAGSGIYGFGGDGGSAATADLHFPHDVVAGPDGSIYISDGRNHRVRRVDAVTGVIRTIAGTGLARYDGDNKPATQASLNTPDGLAFDAAGNLYIADTLNLRIRRVDTQGIIATVVGTGSREPYGYGDGGPAIEATLYRPHGLAFDSAGNLFIADSANHEIRKVDTNGIITTIAGHPNLEGDSGDGGPARVAYLNMPLRLAFDREGSLYFTDYLNNRVRMIDTQGIIHAVAGKNLPGVTAPGVGLSLSPVPIHGQPFGDGGPATEAILAEPIDVEIDANGDLLIADAGNNRVRIVRRSDGMINSIAGNGRLENTGDGGPAWAAALYRPYGLGITLNGDVYVVLSGKNVVRRIRAGYVGAPEMPAWLQWHALHETEL